MKEGQPKSFLEGTGHWMRFGGIIAGVIGLATSPWLVAGGLGAAGGGEIVRRIRKKKNSG
jgi:hypothetical protein